MQLSCNVVQSFGVCVCVRHVPATVNCYVFGCLGKCTVCVDAVGWCVCVYVCVCVCVCVSE